MDIADRVRGVTGALTTTRPGRFLVALQALSRREDLPYLAAALAYYALVSLVPLVVLVVVVASALNAEAVVTFLLELFGRSLSSSGESVVQSTVTAAEGRGGITIAGVAVLAWGALRLFRAMDLSFDRIYGTRSETTILGTVGDMAIVVAGIAVAGGLVVGAAVVLTVLDIPTGLRLIGLVGLPVALFVIFLPFYVGFPDRTIGLREAAPGAVLAALGWSALGTIFQYYATFAGDRAVYGVLGGLLLFVTWLYVANLLLLLGAGTNVVLSGNRPSRPSSDRPSR
jgi:YihY family inner membrane protein